MPKHEYLEYFYPEYRIHMPVSNMENMNTPEYLNSVLEQFLLLAVLGFWLLFII